MTYPGAAPASVWMSAGAKASNSPGPLLPLGANATSTGPAGANGPSGPARISPTRWSAPETITNDGTPRLRAWVPGLVVGLTAMSTPCFEQAAVNARAAVPTSRT